MKLPLIAVLAVAVAHSALAQSGWSEEGRLEVRLEQPPGTAVHKTANLCGQITADATQKKKDGTPKPMKVQWKLECYPADGSSPIKVADGEESTPVTVNTSFSTTSLPAGQHRLRLSATPLTLKNEEISDLNEYDEKTLTLATVVVNVKPSFRGEWADSACIAAGACNSPLHTADVRVSTSEPDMEVTLSLHGGNGTTRQEQH